ncbi:MAG TPA: hypothetical protein VFK02_05465, partial [Kofleriaceae bacterium]|nr:hypothetical protein [Kofleriaceae bacterium]
DVFSLGVILYELVTGSRLFWADNDVASLHRVLSGNVPRPRSHRPELPGALEDIVVTAVAFDAGKRFATALALASALESYAAAAGQPLGARWIARTMEERIGPRHVPWMAAPTVPDVAPPGEGSLVELIAAAGSDEPVSPSFDEAGGDAPGDVDDDAADDPLTVDAPPGAPPPRATRPEPTPEIAAEPSRLPARTRASLRRPALVGLVALVAVTAFGGALALTRSRAPAPATRVTAPVASPAPATAAPRTPASAPVISREPAAPPGSSSPSAGQPAGIDPGAAATHASPTPSPELAPPSPPAAPGPTEASSAPPVPPVAQIEPPPARSTKKRRPSRTPRPGARGVAAGHATVHTAGKVEPPPAPPGPGSGSAAPTTRAPVNVEWKPTLLLPSDGSGARTPR